MPLGQKGLDGMYIDRDELAKGEVPAYSPFSV